MNLLGAITVLGMVVAFCILLCLGASMGKKIVLEKLNKSLLLIAVIGIVIYVLYSAWYLFVMT